MYLSQRCKYTHLNFLEQNCPSNFKIGAKMPITVNFLTFWRIIFFRFISHWNMWQTYVFISPRMMMMRQRMMSEKIKNLTVIDIFAPVLKFDGQFCSKKFYMNIFAPLWQLHEHFWTLALIFFFNINIYLS